MSIPPASMSESYLGRPGQKNYTGNFHTFSGIMSIFLHTRGKKNPNLFKDKFLSSPYNHPNPHPNPKMWFTRRSSQCCSGWESTLRTSQEAQNSLKRGNGWGWGSFFCSQRTSLADIDQVKTVLTCGAHLVTVLPSFPSLVYFKITSQETWQLHVSESCPCHFHKFKSFVRPQLTAQNILRGHKRYCRATKGRSFKERR